MKDAHDKSTMDIAQVNDVPEQTSAGFATQGHARTAAQKSPRRPKPFDAIRSVSDKKTFCAPKPKCAKTVLAFGFEGGHFVPVSFVAKDWSVTPRRIRALLSGGRLAGQRLLGSALPLRVHLRDARPRLETAAKAGTENGMNRKFTLTGDRKMMNMAKLGIVSRAGNYFHSLGNPRKQRDCGLMRYTLCVFQPKGLVLIIYCAPKITLIFA